MRWIGLALVGAAICTVCDHLHATHGVLVYAHPVLWHQAWWVPLLFAAASVVAVAGAMPLRRLFGAVSPDPTPREIAGDGLAFVTAYVFTSFAPADRPNVTLGLLAAWWLSRVVRGRPAWLTVYSLVMAVAGSLFEAGWSALGLFHYVRPDGLGVPRWLPGIYLHAALVAGPLARTLKGADA
jgi:hypothetical protein